MKMSASKHESYVAESNPASGTSVVMTPRDLVGECIMVVFRRKLMILTAFLLGVVGVVGYTYLQYPLYRATVTILVHENPRQQLILFRDIATPAQSSPTTNPAKNLIEISRSTELARQVVSQFDLDDRVARRAETPQGIRERFWYCYDAVLSSPTDLAVFFGLLEDAGPKYEYDAIRQLIDERQEIYDINNTELVKLAIWEEDPLLAVDIANDWGQLLIEKTISMSQSKASTAHDFTKDRAAVAEKELKRIEADFATAKHQQNLVGLEQQQLLLLARLDKARAEFDGVQEQQGGVRGRLDELQRQLTDVPERIPTTTIVAPNPLALELKSSLYAKQRELASRQSELGKDNPEIAGLAAEVSQVDESLAGESPTIVQSEATTVNPLHQDLTAQVVAAETDLEGFAAQSRELQEQLGELQQQVAAMPEKEATLNRLQRQLKTQEEICVTLKQKLAELEVQQLNRLSEFDIRISDSAYLPSNASKDWLKWKTSLLAGVPAALGLALLLAFVVNYFDESYLSKRSLERDLGMQVLGCIPKLWKVK